MKTPMCSVAAMLFLLSAPAIADDRTLNPNDITVEAKRPMLQLNEQQRAAI